MITRSQLAVLCCTALLAACGGGGDSGTTLPAIKGGTSPTPTPTPTPTPAPTLVGIAIAPPPADIPAGYSHQLTATGTFDDGSTRVVSEEVGWTSDAAAFTVSDAAGSRGLATAAASAPAGAQATIRATHAATGVRASVVLTASAAQPMPGSSLQLGITADDAPPACAQASVVAGSTISVPLGCDALFTASASFSDGSTQDVTGGATTTWSLTSSPPGVAQLGYVGGQQVASTLKQGDASIHAALAAAPSIAATASLHVGAPVLAGYSITPDTATIDVGGAVRLSVSSTWTDDSTQTVTPASWTSSSPAVATVDGSGVVTGVTAGAVTVTAKDAGGNALAEAAIIVEAPTAAPTLSYLAFAKGSVRAPATVRATVVLTALVLQPTTVAVASSSAIVTPPATVTIPAGSDRASFDVSVTAPATRRQKVTLRATLGGRTVSATLNVRR